MDGKSYFKKCCKELGINCDTYFRVHAQKSKTKTHYVCKSDDTKRNDNHLFVINYNATDNLYLAWNLKQSLSAKRNTFILAIDTVSIINADKVQSLSKIKEHIGHGEEIVYVFPPGAINDFLNKVCISKINNK